MPSNIKVGHIYIVEGLPINPPKAKFAICLSVKNMYFFVTNSENRKMYDCIPLTKKGRPFPRKDCFIGCKNLFKAEATQIKREVGELDPDEIRVLRAKVQSSAFLSPIQIEAILAELA